MLFGPFSAIQMHLLKNLVLRQERLKQQVLLQEDRHEVGVHVVCHLDLRKRRKSNVGRERGKIVSFLHWILLDLQDIIDSILQRLLVCPRRLLMIQSEGFSLPSPYLAYSPPPIGQQPAPSARPQTHSSSLNAILASPISTPRLHPAKWSYSPTEQSSSHNGYAPPPPLPPPPPPIPSNGHFVPHYRYPTDTNMASTLPASMHPTPLSHQPHSPGLDHRRGQDTCLAKLSHSNASSPMGEQSFTTTSSPPPPPPIVSTGPIPLSASSFDSDAESEDEFDELLPSSPEPEPVEVPEPVHESYSHRIPDIEACIDPATGITAEEVKAAMDAVLKSQQEQEQQQVNAQNAVDADEHGGMNSGIGGIRVSSTTDHDGSPFLSEISSSTLVNGHSHNLHGRHALHGLPDVHRSPGRRIRRDCRTSSSSGNHHDDHRQSEGEEEDIGASGSGMDMDMDERSNIKAYAAGNGAGGGGRLLEKVKADRINELHEHEDDDYGPPSLDRSPSSLDHHHIINEDGEHMLHPGKWSVSYSPILSLISFIPLGRTLDTGSAFMKPPFSKSPRSERRLPRF